MLTSLMFIIASVIIYVFISIKKTPAHITVVLGLEELFVCVAENFGTCILFAGIMN